MFALFIPDGSILQYKYLSVTRNNLIYPILMSEDNNKAISIYPALYFSLKYPIKIDMLRQAILNKCIEMHGTSVPIYI